MPALAHLSKVKSGGRERISFARHKEIMEVPYLIEMQKSSYEKFLKEGIGKVLKEFGQISDYSNKADLFFLDYYFEGEPKYTQAECKVKKVTYSVPLKVKCRLVIKESGQVIEQDVFLGDIPLMSDNGTFMINGVKRVVLSQLARSSGAYYDGVIDKTGKTIYYAKVIPMRGAWIEIEQTSADILKVIVDKQSKMSIGILLKSLGLGSDADIIKIFGDNQTIRNTLEKEPQKDLEEILLELAKKLRPSDVPSIEAASKYINELFFTQARYDLEEVGRYKFDQKLGLSGRLTGCTLAADIVSPDGEVVGKKGEVVTRERAVEIQNSGVNDAFVVVGENSDKIHKVVGNNRVDIYAYTGLTQNDIGFNPKLNVYYPEIAAIWAKNKTKEKRINAIKENAANLLSQSLTIDDIIAIVCYMLDLNAGLGHLDQIDHLGNRRVRTVGETMEKAFRTGVIKLKQFIQEKMQVQDFNEVTPSGLISARQINNAIKEFTQSSQLSHNMDEVNIIATLTDKRRLTSVGPGGIDKDRAGADVRDIHYSQYGRICPIETPEGENIGIVLSLANHAKINEFGFLITPYRRVDKVKGIVTNEIVYLTAYEEDEFLITEAGEPLDAEGHFVNQRVIARKKDEVIEVFSKDIDFVDVSTKQFCSTVASLIPFIENDDTNRALMACNMQRQAVPLIRAEAPIVATGMEAKIARDSGFLIIAKNDGVVKYVSAERIVVNADKGVKEEYVLNKFEKSNANTCINQKPIVNKGQKVKAGDILADGFSTDMGELAIGRNPLIAFMNWDGYNFEDAILISERIVKDDVYTSIYLSEVSVKATATKLGDEEITADIPNLSEDALKNLDENGIICIGAEVRPGDILVGKVTPKGETELSPEERLLRAIFGEKAREVRDTSLRVEHGQGGIVVGIKQFSRENKDDLENGVNAEVRVTIAQKRKLKVGDKMSGRHGNKGVVSLVLPEADMPFMPDGTPIDIVLNPLGVPSRMNIGQILETHLSFVAKNLGWHIESPSFDGATEKDIQQLLIENSMPADGKIQLYDGRTGEPFSNFASVGYMYMLKLNHMVDSKVHARSTGPYALVTQQPLGGKAQFGGQRFGEMEVWALEAYGAANLLQEMLTVKSDDAIGRIKTLESIVQGAPIGEPGIPEGFKVLVKEMQALGLDVKVLTDDKKEINMSDITNLDGDIAGFKPQEEKLSEIDLYDNGDAGINVSETANSVLDDMLKSDINVNDLFDSSALFEE